MVFSTSEVDTLNFNKFVEDFNGGASAGARLVNEFSATSPWNTEMMGGAGGMMGSKTMKYILIAIIIYFLFFSRSTSTEVKSSTSRGKQALSSEANKTTISISKSDSSIPKQVKKYSLN